MAVSEATSSLTLRQSRALERIGDPELRERAAIELLYLGLPEEAAEGYVNAVLHPELPRKVRSFLLAMESTLPEGAEYIREDADNCVKLTLRIPL